jgi:PKD repeat protein
LFVDGVQYIAGTAAWNPLNLELAVGESNSRTYDDIAVYNKVLPIANIKDHTTRGLNGAPCSLVGATIGYGKTLGSDGAIGVWRLGGGPVAFDSVGCRNGFYGDGATFEAGAVVGDTDLALRSGGEMRTYVGDVIPGGSAVSLEFWSKGAGSQGWIGRIGHFGVYRTTRCCNPQTVTLQFAPGVFAQVDLGANGLNIDADAWHHYVLTHDGVNSGKLYIDGALYLTGTAAWDGLVGEVVVGESRGRATDELAVYDKVLTPDVIRSHFSATFASEPCSNAAALSGYAQQTRVDGAIGLWRAGDEGRVAYDTIGCRNASYGDGAVFPAGVIAGDSDKAFTSTVGALRGDLTGAIVPGGSVSLEFWSKGAGSQGWLARVGHFGVYRTTRCCNPQTVTLQFAPGVYSQIDLGAGGINIDLDVWHHFVVTHDGVNSGKLYIDGVLYLSGTAAWNAMNNDLAVGESLNRTYDEIALYSKALTAAQVLGRYQVAQKISTQTTLTGSTDWGNGLNLQFTATVASTVGVVAGSIQLMDGETVLQTKPVPSPLAPVTFTASLDTGEHTISARYVGSTTHLPSRSAAIVRVSNGRLSTTVSATLTPTNPVLNQPVTVTVTVGKPSAVAEVPTGTITVTPSGASPITGEIDPSGRATVTITGLVLGATNLSIAYSGDSVFAGSTGTQSVTVRDADATTMSVVASPNPAPLGSRVTVAATVLPPTGVPGVPTGVVKFTVGGVEVATSNLNGSGTATYTYDSSVLGLQTVNAGYAGNAFFASTLGAVTVRTVGAAAQVTLTLPASVRAGAPATATIKVVPTGTQTVPTGEVILKNGTVTVGTAILDGAGSAQIAIDTSVPGDLQLVANYAGDTNTSGATSAMSTFTVRPSTNAVVLSVSVPKVSVGKPVVATAQVDQIDGKPVPTGTVNFTIAGVQRATGTLDAQGNVLVTINGLTQGAYVLTATHVGDSAYPQTVSVPVTVEVLPEFAVTIAASPTTGTAPFTTTLAATVNRAGTTTMEWSFGDDTPVGSRSSVPHTFTEPGTYQVSVRATVDGQTATKLLLVQVTAAPLAAKLAVSDIRTVEGLSVGFDASPSSGPVRSVRWDFGDGTFGDGYTPSHTYTTPGTYTVTLTVADAAVAGLINTVTGTVRVAARTDARLVVNGTNGTGLGGVDLFLRSTTTPTREYRGITSADGRAVLPALENDTYDVYAYKDGFLPKRVALTLPPAATELDKIITLDAGQVADVQIAPPVVLTATQIAAAGIDTSKPENRQVTVYQLSLGASPSGGPTTVSVCVNANSQEVACPVQANAATPVTSSGGGGGGAGSSSGTTYAGGGQIIYTTVTKETVTYLTMPLQGSFVKEFFQARMVIANRATQAGFTLHDGTAQIAVPPNMTVMPNRLPFNTNCAARRIDPSPTAPAAGWPLRVTVGDIPAGGCAEIDWILRGDTSCSCFISGGYDAVLAPFERVVRAVAKSSEPFVVYGAESLQVVADLIGSDALTPVAGQPNTFEVKAGTTVEYRVIARNVTPNRTLTGLEISYPGVGGVTALGPFISNAQTVDQPVRATIDSLGPLQEKEVGRLKLYATADATVSFTAPLTAISALSAPGVVNAPTLKTPGYFMAYAGSTRTIEWDPVPGAISYELYASDTNLLPATPVATITAVDGVAPSWVIPAGSPLDAFKIADIVTTTTAAPGDRYHRPLVRPDGTSDCFGRLTTVFVCAGGATTGSGTMTAVITRLPNIGSDRMYQIELKTIGLTPGARVKFRITKPTGIVLIEPNTMNNLITVPANGTVTLTVTAKNPRGIFNAETINNSSTPRILGTAEVK